MKKGDLITLKIESFRFPDKAWGFVGEGDDRIKVTVKDALPGQTLTVRIVKKRGNRAEGKVLERLSPGHDERPVACPVFGRCGGCTFTSLPADQQLIYKEDYVRSLLSEVDLTACEWLPIVPSPEQTGYRNKMEFSFGDDTPGGPLTLGLHEKGSFYNILNAEHCEICDADFGVIVKAVRQYFALRGTPYYHKRNHTGFLRHLVLRKGKATGEILVNLVTSSDAEDHQVDPDPFVAMLLMLPLKGHITGIVHTVNDGLADVVKADALQVLYGSPMFHDALLGLTFDISPFSFFQTNTFGAEQLYSVVREFVGDVQVDTLFDLYCGTGTIAQLLAPKAKQVYGIELVPEAVEAAKANAAKNGIDNCTFIAGDVLTEVHRLTDHPDLIILDPPREGIHPKAIFKILDFAPDVFVYVSCKAASLARDLPFFTAAGYTVRKIRCVDLFPGTGHVETVVLLSGEKVDRHINVDLDAEKLEGKNGTTTHAEIKAYIKEKYRFSVTSLYIGKIENKVGIKKRKNYNIGSGYCS